MIDLPWKIFSQTGNIEAYLWMKEIEPKDEKEEDQDFDHSVLEDTHN